MSKEYGVFRPMDLRRPPTLKWWQEAALLQQQKEREPQPRRSRYIAMLDGSLYLAQIDGSSRLARIVEDIV